MIPALVAVGAVVVFILLRPSSADAGSRQNASGLNPSSLSYRELQIQKFGAIATIAGAAATGLTAALSVPMATAGPVGAVVAAAVLAIGAFRGTAHLVANEWVQKVQNPFGTALGAVVDEKDKAVRDGSASRAMLVRAKEAVVSLWAKYVELAEQFKLKDADHKIVIENSYRTLDYLVRPDGTKEGSGLITRILADLDREIATIN